MFRKLALVLFILILGTSASQALVKGRAKKLYNFGIIVWKSYDAMGKGWDIIESGVNKSRPELLARYVNCFIEPGTSIAVTSVGMLAHDIIVTSGPKTGCEGTIQAEEFQAN